jgi:hypothetical protein
MITNFHSAIVALAFYYYPYQYAPNKSCSLNIRNLLEILIIDLKIETTDMVTNWCVKLHSSDYNYLDLQSVVDAMSNSF